MAQAQIQYRDPIMKKYADLITANTSNFKRIYFGDPIRIGVSELPALIISKTKTDISNETNAGDLHNVKLTFTIVTDIRETISDDRDMVRGIDSLYNICEGRNDDYTLKTDSLAYILRHNVELDIAHQLRTDLNTVTSFDYGMTIGKRTPTAWAIEATVSIVANFHQLVR